MGSEHMRKLKLQVQMSVDGFISGPNGEMDWMIFDWDDELKECVTEITTPIDCIVLGRKLAQGFIPHWAAVAANPDDPEYTAGRKFTDTYKIVFTRTLDQSEWDNTVLAKGDLVDEISKLKEQGGNDIIAYGGGTFVSALLKHGLIDELNLFVSPVALGAGMTIFRDLESRQKFVLETSKAFACGIVLIRYRKAA
jgi:dihydrofolate reductase